MESISAFRQFNCSYLPQKPHKTIELPKQNQERLTVVFDLDETLVHAQVMDWNLRVEDLGEGKVVDIEHEDGRYQVHLKIRPFAAEVLRRLSQKF